MLRPFFRLEEYWRKEHLKGKDDREGVSLAVQLVRFCPPVQGYRLVLVRELRCKKTET